MTSYIEKYDTLESIERLQRVIIVHSYAYYYLDRNLNSDQWFDKRCKEMEDIINNNKDLFKKSKFYSIYENYSPCSTYYLIRRDLDDYHGHFIALAQWLIRKQEEGYRGVVIYP